MKTILIGLFLIGSTAYASDPVCIEEAEHITDHVLKDINTDTPAWLKGAKIIVRKADGSESSVPAERFKVVPRKQQFIVEKFLTAKTLTCTTNTPRKNRVSLLGGSGTKSGLDTSTSGTTTTVESRTGAVGGAQYQRMLGERLSLGIQGQTNETGSLLLGIDF